MATSELEVCKLALAKIGSTNFPSALTEQTAEAILCNLEYPQVRDTTFELVKPAFAQRSQALALLAETRSSWLYVYGAPSDFLALTGVRSDLGRFLPLDMREDYDVELSADGASKVIVTNVEAVEMTYIARVTTVGNWTPIFTDAVVYGLAAVLALSLKKDVPTADAMMKMYELKMSQASASSESQRNLGQGLESAIIRSRA